MRRAGFSVRSPTVTKNPALHPPEDPQWRIARDLLGRMQGRLLPTWMCARSLTPQPTAHLGLQPASIIGRDLKVFFRVVTGLGTSRPAATNAGSRGCGRDSGQAASAARYRPPRFRRRTAPGTPRGTAPTGGRRPIRRPTWLGRRGARAPTARTEAPRRAGAGSACLARQHSARPAPAAASQCCEVWPVTAVPLVAMASSPRAGRPNDAPALAGRRARSDHQGLGGAVLAQAAAALCYARLWSPCGYAPRSSRIVDAACAVCCTRMVWCGVACCGVLWRACAAVCYSRMVWCGVACLRGRVLRTHGVACCGVRARRVLCTHGVLCCGVRSQRVLRGGCCAVKGLDENIPSV